MTYYFLSLALIIAVIDWVAVAKNWKKVEYFAKPGVMVALLAWLWEVGGLQGYLMWFAVGLLLSMAGDVFLMLPREQFIAGLVAFLLAHVAYIIGFNAIVLPPLTAAALILALLVGLTAGQVGRRIVAGLAAAGKTRLKGPVMVYAAVISLMLLSALLTLTRREWTITAATLASAGAFLFFISDTFLAWNKFVSPLPNGRLQVIITYHLGQALIVLSAVFRFLLPH